MEGKFAVDETVGTYNVPAPLKETVDAPHYGWSVCGRKARYSKPDNIPMAVLALILTWIDEHKLLELRPP